jgi:hypothetical protein
MHNPINLVGVVSGTTAEPPTISDYATGTDRPLIDCGAYTTIFDNYWLLRNLRWTGSAAYVVHADAYIYCHNCYFENTNSGDHIIYVDYGQFFDCEFVTDGAYGARITTAYGLIINCYIHGSPTTGISIVGDHGTVFGNIVSGATTGIDLGAETGVFVAQNTLYDCSTAGIDATTSGSNIIINNILCNCGKGIYGNASYPQALVDYNNYYNNTTDVDGVTKGPNALAVNPNFTDAANGDFSLDSASDLIGAGLGIQLGVG